MDYQARIDIDLTFHTLADLTQTLHTLARYDHHASPWGLLARLSEYAEVDLHQLHLTGRGSGRLLHGPAHLLDTLAVHADGTLRIHGEDDIAWQITLLGGVVTGHRLPAAYELSSTADLRRPVAPNVPAGDESPGPALALSVVRPAIR